MNRLASQSVSGLLNDPESELTNRSREVRTVLFVDVVDSTSMIGRAGDLAWFASLTEFFRLSARLIAKHGGLLIKTIGDSFMATFRDERSALVFALDLWGSLLKAPIVVGDTPITFRAGIHSGMVFLDGTSYGNDLFGAAVNIAARLTTLAAPGQVVISGVSHQALSRDQQCLLRATESASVKGFGNMEVSRIDLHSSQLQ
jgi:adenylate cyclase